MSEGNSGLIRYFNQIAEGETELILPQVETVAVTPQSSTLELVETTNTSPPLPDTVTAELMELAATASTCTQCGLADTRQNVVFGVGNPHADLMFIGEAPGADEDKAGEPFVGRAGKLLNKIIVAMKLERDDVYIANILKCRPPGNRNPNPDEAAACLPYLLKQIELVDPKVIVGLGLVAAQRLLDTGPKATMKSLHGRILRFQGRPFVVSYHPAALLRNQAFKAPTWADMQVVMKILSGEIDPNVDSNDTP